MRFARFQRKYFMIRRVLLNPPQQTILLPWATRFGSSTKFDGLILDKSSGLVAWFTMPITACEGVVLG